MKNDSGPLFYLYPAALVFLALSCAPVTREWQEPDETDGEGGEGGGCIDCWGNGGSGGEASASATASSAGGGGAGSGGGEPGSGGSGGSVEDADCVSLPGPNDRVLVFCSEEARTFWGAEKACQSRGGHLASMHSVDEQKMIADGALVSSKGLWLPWWIGLNDVDAEGSFVWTDGTPLDFESWKLGEPNNSAGVEDCVNIHNTEESGWNDLSCDDFRPYICLLP
jgi:hypothetical protein